MSDVLDEDACDISTNLISSFEACGGWHPMSIGNKRVIKYVFICSPELG
jgi:hypothetical protein